MVRTIIVKIVLSFIGVSHLIAYNAPEQAQQWYTDYIAPLPFADQKKVASFFWDYHRASYLDAKFRKELLHIQHLLATSHYDISPEDRSTIFVKIAAHAQWLTQYLLEKREAALSAWNLSAAAMEQTDSSAIYAAIQDFQKNGRLFVADKLEEFRFSLFDEAKETGKALESSARKLAQYAPVYASLFQLDDCEELEEPGALIQDYDTATQIIADLDEHTDKIRQTTLVIKLSAIELELKTSELIKLFYEQFNNDIRIENPLFIAESEPEELNDNE